MSDVQFEEEEKSNREATAFLVRNESPTSYITGLILKTGIVKTTRLASIVLFIIACVFFTATIYLYTHKGVQSKISDTMRKLPPELMAKFPTLNKKY